MKNIFIEGLPGSGKSRLLQVIHEKFPQMHVCREGDYSPVGLTWCAWMTKEQYETILDRYIMIREEIVKNTFREDGHYIVTYTKIITDIPGFHKDMMKYEIYDGRIPFLQFRNVILERYEKFHGTGYLAECAFMQNIMETLILFYQLDDEEILNFYRRLFDKIDKTSFRLLYLYCDNISEIVRIVKEERTDLQGNMLWYNTMMAYIRQSPYGKSHNDIVRDCVMEHFQRRQQLELSIMENVVGEYGHIIVAKQWDWEQVFEAIDMDHNVFNNGK